MAKKKDCLLSVTHDEKSLSAISDEGATSPAIGSTSHDALLVRSGTSNAVSIVDETSCPASSTSTCTNNQRNNNNNDTNKIYGGKYDNGFTFTNGEQTPSDDHLRSGAPKCPWRGMTMAVVLLLFGSLLIMAGIALISGAFQLKGLDNVTPYLILVFGALCFIPGAYHILVACCALRGHERFSFEDIPYFG